MSLGYYEGSDLEATKLIARYMEHLNKEENYKSFADLFTESEILELESVLDECCDSVKMRHELDVDGDWPDGFSISSSDEKVLSLMRVIKEKQIDLAIALRQSARVNGVFSKPDVNAMSDKSAWMKYMDYCEQRLLDYVPDSPDFLYYENEIAKCQQEIDRL